MISNFQSDVGNVVKFSYQNIKHITLICQHDKLPLVRNCFCMKNTQTISQKILYEFWDRDISRTESTIMLNFYSIFVIIRNRENKLFSVITQPWRHPGAILCFDVIIDIFISVYHKLTKFNTHKLQVIRQHTDNPCPSARHDAHVRARQNLTCSKSPINNFEHEPGHLEHFKIFRPYVSARVLCARTARGKVKFQNVCMIWISLTIIDNFHSFAVTLDLS